MLIKFNQIQLKISNFFGVQKDMSFIGEFKIDEITFTALICQRFKLID